LLYCLTQITFQYNDAFGVDPSVRDWRTDRHTERPLATARSNDLLEQA